MVETEYLWYEISLRCVPFWISPQLAIRFRLLKHTRLNVVAFLNELPKTQHDIASFTVDVNTYTVSSCLFHLPALVINLFPLTLNHSVLILQNCFPCTEHTTLIHSERSLQRRWVVSSSWFNILFSTTANISGVDFVTNLGHVFFSVAVDGKSRESTMAFSRVFITVPAGSTG